MFSNEFCTVEQSPAKEASFQQNAIEANTLPSKSVNVPGQASDAHPHCLHHAEEFMKIALLIALAAVGDLLGADVAHTILLNPKGFITVSSTTSICVPPASSSLIFLVSILLWRACKSESLFAGKCLPKKNQFLYYGEVQLSGQYGRNSKRSSFNKCNENACIILDIITLD
jgi:hypothetical protein